MNFLSACQQVHCDIATPSFERHSFVSCCSAICLLSLRIELILHKYGNALFSCSCDLQVFPGQLDLITKEMGKDLYTLYEHDVLPFLEDQVSCSAACA
jgi:hypothetical protein